MNLYFFLILTFLATVYVGMTAWETELYHKVEKAQAEQKSLQYKMAYFQQINAFMDQVVRNMVQNSVKDPALSDLLKKYKINVVIMNNGAPAGGDTASPAASGSAPSDPLGDMPQPAYP